MKSIEISGSVRTNIGTKFAKEERKSGLVPCVLYGNKETIHFNADEKSLQKLIYTPHVFEVQLTIDGKTYRSIIQASQFHPVSEAIVHLDFLELSDDKKVKISLPVTIAGVSPGVLQGGKLVINSRKLAVRAFPNNLPEDITVDISSLGIGQAVRIKDVQVANFEFIDKPSAVIAMVKTTRNVVTETPANSKK